MYHNIVFDLGGVVINYAPKDYLVDRFYSERTEKALHEDVFGSEEWELLDKGEITWRQAREVFLQRAEERDLAFEMQTLLDEWTEMMSTRTATVNLMRLLKKKGFNIYYLSNMSKEVFDLIRQRDFFSLFEGGVVSCEVGVVKPDIEIYRQFLQKYSLVPQETIFTDDVRQNTAAAFEAGITGIQFKNVKSFCKMLVTYGIDI